jgi:hypothetical protein
MTTSKKINNSKELHQAIEALEKENRGRTGSYKAKFCRSKRRIKTSESIK